MIVVCRCCTGYANNLLNRLLFFEHLKWDCTDFGIKSYNLDLD